MPFPMTSGTYKRVQVIKHARTPGTRLAHAGTRLTLWWDSRSHIRAAELVRNVYVSERQPGSNPDLVTCFITCAVLRTCLCG